MATTTDLRPIAEAEQAIDALVEMDLDPNDISAALELTRRVERLSRKVLAVQIGVLGTVEERQLHRPDGHASGRVFV